MTDKDITTICEKIDSLHAKILKSKFAEVVTESEMMSLILAVVELNRQKAENERLLQKLQQPQVEAIKEFAERLKEIMCQENEIYISCAKNMLSKDFQRGYEEKNDDVIKHINNLVKEMGGDN